MKKCTVCGMAKDANAAHGSAYSGPGKHTFAVATKKSETEGAFDDIIVNFGGELKSLGDGGFEGYLVRYSTADDPDLVGDYFTKSTEFFLEDGQNIPLLYDHGLNRTLKKTKIGRATVSFDDVGLFIKGELDVRNKWVKAVNDKLLSKGKLGLSSGAASHMVERRQVKKGVNEILSWGIAEGSATPAPTEPRCEVYSLKSYFDMRDDSFFEDEIKAAKPDPLAASTEHAFKGSPTDPTECQVCGEEFAEGLHTKSMKRIKTEKRDGKDKFVLYSMDGSKELGVHDNMADALAQEKAIEIAKKKERKGFEDEFMGSEDFEEQLAESVIRPLKGLFEEKLKEKVPSVWETRQTLDEVYKDIANAAVVQDITNVTIDIAAKVKEAKIEEAAREIPLVAAQIQDWVNKGGNKGSDGCGGSRYFYLRSLPLEDIELSIKSSLGDGITLDEHSERVVYAVEEFANLGASVAVHIKSYVDRCVKKFEYRQSDPTGPRSLGPSTLEKAAELKAANIRNIEMLTNVNKELDALLTKASPSDAPNDSDVLSMSFAIEKLQTDLALDGLAV